MPRSSLSLANNQLSGPLPAFWGSAGYWPALQELTLQVGHTLRSTSNHVCLGTALLLADRMLHNPEYARKSLGVEGSELT